QDLWQSHPAGEKASTSLLGKEPTPLLVQVVVADTEEPSLLSALAGVLKVAQQEFLTLRGQLIEVEGKPDEAELLTWLRENQLRPQEPYIRYSCGKRWVRAWQEVGTDEGKPHPYGLPWKEGGCYLITGGAGGLAQLFVKEIARHVKTATVILVGRSSPGLLRAVLIALSRARWGGTC